MYCGKVVNNSVNLAHFLCSLTSDGHSSDANISVMLSCIFLLHGQLNINIAALCCIISIL